MAMQVSEERSKTVHYIGIDLAKRKHSAAVVGGDGERLVRGFEFANDAEGFASLLEKLASVGAGRDESGVCLEATGHYGRNLIAFLEAHGYEVFEVNPLLTSNWRKATSVRKVKNDAVDAEALALWLLAGNPTRRRRSKSESDDIRSLARSRTSLSHIVGDCKRRAHAILDVVFPEFHGFFADDFGKSASAVLRKWGSAEALAKARVDSVEKAMRSGGGRRFTRADAERLKELARSSVGQPSAPLSFQLRQLLDQIEFTRSQMKELDAELEKLVGDSPITTDAPMCCQDPIRAFSAVARKELYLASDSASNSCMRSSLPIFERVTPDPLAACACVRPAALRRGASCCWSHTASWGPVSSS